MKRSQWVLLFGILIVSLNLRPAVSSVSPVLETIRADLALSYTAVALLTTIPTLCMGVFALAAPSVSERVGRERGVFWGAVLIAVATAARLGSQSAVVLFGSTVLVGVGIAVTQALLPPLVTTYFTDRESFATGLYTAGLTVGAALAGAATPPLATRLGSWTSALAVWALPAVVAVPVWYLSWRGSTATNTSSGTQSSADRAHLPWRNRWAVVVTLYFGGSSMVFFFALAWLAPRYVALGWSSSRAGLLLSVFIIGQLGGILAVSAVGDRLYDQRPLYAVMLLSAIAGAVGIATVPLFSPWAWAVLLGSGVGGSFTLALTLPVVYAADPPSTDALTSMMLAGGYSIAALGPFLGGLLRDLTGSYQLTFAVVVALEVTLLGAALLFDPDRTRLSVGESDGADG